MAPTTTASPGVFQIVPGRDDRGGHVFSVILKRSYRIVPGASAERLDSDAALRLIDEYYDQGDPEWSVVEHESELAPLKALTDVVVVGKAYAPGGRPIPRMGIEVQVGDRSKRLLVSGDRHCHFRGGGDPDFSDPEPFAEMDIRYDRAYGGRDEVSLPNVPFFYPRNFMGRGVVMRNVQEAVEGLPLPNIEDPEDLIMPERLFIGEPDRWHLQPIPQGFGWRQRTWYPRSALLGSYPAFLDPGIVTAEETMGLVPPDHVALAKQFRLRPLEEQFANGASIGLMFNSFRGDETVTLRGLTSDGELAFALPGETPAIGLDLGSGLKPLDVHVHTVSIRPDDMQVDLIWRGALAYAGYAALSTITKMHAEIV